MNTNELYQQITNEIIELMEGQLTVYFDKPWIEKAESLINSTGCSL